MKRLLLFSAFLAICATVFAQTKQANKSCPVFYLGASLGINNNPGIIGINADLPVSDKVSVGAGVGASFWGSKSYGSVTYYFGQCHKGWAVGAGITHNSGIDNIKRTLHTISGKQDVTLDLRPMTNVFFAGYRFWNVGKRGNRLFLMFGWSAAVTRPRYDVISGQTLTSDQKDRIKALAPGGLVLGTGFHFAFHSKH